jgi:hypothetical protein
MKTYTEERKAELKAIIIDYIAKNPGARKRDLGRPCGEWHCNLIGIVSELEREGTIYSEYIHDLANMESYDKYYKNPDKN